MKMTEAPAEIAAGAFFSHRFPLTFDGEVRYNKDKTRDSA